MLSFVKKSVVAIKEGGFPMFFKKSGIFFVGRMKPLRNLLFYSWASYSFLRLNRNNYSINELVQFAFHGVGELIRPAQVKSEITKLTEIVKALQPKTVMEIGTCDGGTLFLFSRVADKSADIISLDLGYSEWKIPLYKKFSLLDQKLKLLRGNSHDKTVFEHVKKLLNGKQIDFLFVDGDHAYEGVKKDFEMYSALVRPGGIIAFHDVAVHPAKSGCAVNRFWEEVKRDKKFEELIENKDQKWGGIGVLYV